MPKHSYHLFVNLNAHLLLLIRWGVVVTNTMTVVKMRTIIIVIIIAGLVIIAIHDLCSGNVTTIRAMVGAFMLSLFSPHPIDIKATVDGRHYSLAPLE